MSNPSNRQMNVPIPTRHEEEIQTDVNLLGGISRYDPNADTNHVISSVFEYATGNRLSPFSDNYLLGHLGGLITALKEKTTGLDDYKSQSIISQLSGHIHGLIAKELRICGEKSDFYSILNEKEKEIIRLQIKYAHFENKINGYEGKIQALEREIQSLRSSLKIYQGAAAENQLYKAFFKQIQQTVSGARRQDLDSLIKNEISKKVSELDINLQELSKSTGRDRSKLKGAISRYALELDQLSKNPNLNWQDLNSSAAGFFTSLEHLNADDWIQERIHLASRYEELRNRHTAILSVVRKNIDQLIQKDRSFSSLSEVRDLEEKLRRESQAGMETVIVNGWIGLGVLHCHRHMHSEDQYKNVQELALLFQSEVRRLIERFPQLKGEISASLADIMKLEIVGEIVEGRSLGWLKQIMERQIQVVTVDNVYKYYSNTDRQVIFHLRVLIKALLEEFDRISKTSGVQIELDEAILCMLRDQILDGCDIADVLACFRPAARICEVGTVINTPYFVNGIKHVGVPLKQERGVSMNNLKHVPVYLKDLDVHFGEKPFGMVEQVAIIAKETAECSYGVNVVDERICGRVIIEQNIKDHPTTNEILRVDCEEKVVPFRENQIVYQDRIKDRECTQEIVKTEIREVHVPKEVPKYIYKDVTKIVKVPEYVPVIHEKPIHKIVDKLIYIPFEKPEVHYLTKKEVVFECQEVIKEVEVCREKRVTLIDHCDCQRPEPVECIQQMELIKEIEKEIIVEKCHYIKGDEVEHILPVECITQQPLIHEVIMEVERCVEKVVPLHTYQEKLIVVNRDVPFEVCRYEPVRVVSEKPVIMTNECVKEIRVEVPVPVYIEKEVIKVVRVVEEKIVQCMVEVPKVEIVEKIVEKIVCIPRIIEKIVCVPQIIEKVVTVECPVLELVTIEIEKVVPCIQEREVIVECREEVLKIEKTLEVCEVEKPYEVCITKDNFIEVEVCRDVIVEKIIEIPRDIIKEKIVERVIKLREVIPIETIVQVPIHVPVPVALEKEKPVFYKQVEEHIVDCRLEVEKVVEVCRTVPEIREICQEVPIIEERPVQVPGNTEIIYENCLEIVEFYKDNYISCPEVVEKPTECYLDLNKVECVTNQEFVIGKAPTDYLDRPVEIRSEVLVTGKHENHIPVEMGLTCLVGTRTIDQVIKVERACTEKLKVDTREVKCPEVHEVIKQVPYLDNSNVKIIEKNCEVLKVDEKCVEKEVFIERVAEGFREILYKTEVVPEYIEKVVEKILMLPQIVEIEKKVYMIEEINSLIAKEVDLQVYTKEYRETVDILKVRLDEVLAEIRKKRGDKSIESLAILLQEFRGIVYSVDKMPKIVEVIKEVVKEVDRDRPVLIPVFNSEQELCLELIIHDLVAGISKFRKEQIQKNFDASILDLFNIELLTGDSGFRKVDPKVSQEKLSGYGRSWIRDYDHLLPNTHPLVHLSEKYKTYYHNCSARGTRWPDLVASFEKHYLQDSSAFEESAKIIEVQKRVIEQLQNEKGDLLRDNSTLAYEKDKLSNEIAVILSRFRSCIPDDRFNEVYLEYLPEHSEGVTRSVIKYGSTLAGSEYHGASTVGASEVLLEKEKKLSEIYGQLSIFESSVFEEKRRVSVLERENELLREDLNILKSTAPEGETSLITDRINRDWESRVRSLEETYQQEISRLRDQMGTSTRQDSTAFNDLINQNRQLNEELRGLRRDYDNLKQIHDRCSYNLENERRKIIDEYERRLKGSQAPGAIEKDLRREIETLKKAAENSQRNFDGQKQRIIDDYERKINSTASNQEKELRRELETLKRTQQLNEQNFESQRQREADEYERKLRNLQQELDRLKTSSSSRRESTTISAERQEEIRRMNETIRNLQLELENSKREIESYQKSRLGQTSYTSVTKQSDFQSPNIDYRSIERERGSLRSPQTEEELQESLVGGKRVVRSGVKIQKKYEETEEVRSSSSRISGGSEGGYQFKSSMNMREFMDIKKNEDKDNIATLVMIKVIERIMEEAEKGMLNSYSPNNIFLSNFNPNNIDSLIVRFGAPITNRKSKNDGLYLAPEIHRGEATSLKSVVFTLAVIWDELIHYEIYFKSNEEIENLSHEFKVRDTRLNPILKNTLFEMMSKDPSKRIELAEAKRRLSLQRYILSEGRAVASSSRVSSQSRRE